MSVRQRLKTSLRPDGALNALNGLGVDIEALYVADDAGAMHRASRVAAGAQATLERMEGVRAEGGEATLRDLYDSDWLRNIDRLTKKPAEHLRPGSYIAVVDGAPFLESGLEKAASRRARSVIYGILERGER